jgi:hypothetical protein
MIKLITFTILLISGCTTNRLINIKQFKKNRTLVYTDYGSSSYHTKDIDNYIEALATLKSRSASLLYTCYTENINTSNINCDSYDSPKRSNLIYAIKKLKKLGFTISLRVYVDLKSNDWRAKWDPKDKKEAFKHLKSTLLDFAAFAQKHGVKDYVIGSEYERLTKPTYSHYWIDIINHIKSRYNGKIIYAANGNVSTFSKAEYEWINFWDNIGSIAVNHYPSFNGEPTFNKLKSNHLLFIKRYQKIQKKWNLPLYYTEVGFPLSSKGHIKPYQWIWDNKIGINKKLQRTNITSFIAALKKTKYSKIYFWRHMPFEQQTHPQGYLISDEDTLELITSELDN